MKVKSYLASGLLALASVVSTQAVAAPIVYSGSSGALAASVSFEVVGSQLKVVLSNTSSADILVPVDVLTGVFFNVTGNLGLSRDSAISGGVTHLGSSVVSNAGAVVGGEWAYRNSLSQYSANSGISSSGLGIFGPSNRFPGSNLSGPPSGSPGGLEYGLASAGDNVNTGNTPILTNQLTQNSVTFMLGGFSGFSLADVSNITFQYGTNLSEGHFEGRPEVLPPISIPEPATLALLGFGLAGIGALRRRKA